MDKGFGLIAGRSREHAKAALAAAEAAGLPANVVLTSDDGYIVPEAVLDAYEAQLKQDFDNADLDPAASGDGEPDEKPADEKPADEEVVDEKPLTAAQKKAAAKAAAAQTSDAPAPE